MEESFTPLFHDSLAGWQMAGYGRVNVIGGTVLETEGGPGVLWYSSAAFTDYVLCVDWRLSNLDDNSGVYLRFPPLGRDDPEHDWQLADRRGYEVQTDAADSAGLDGGSSAYSTTVATIRKRRPSTAHST